MRTASVSVPRSTIAWPSAVSVSSTSLRRCTPRWSKATPTFTAPDSCQTQGPAKRPVSRPLPEQDTSLCLTAGRGASGHTRAQREGERDHVVDRVAELLEHDVARSRGAEVLDRERVPVVADPLLPPER